MKKVLKFLLIVVLIIALGIGGYYAYQQYKYQKAIEYFRDSTATAVSLTDEQISIIDEKINNTFAFDDSSLDDYFTEADYKESFGFSCEDYMVELYDFMKEKLQTDKKEDLQYYLQFVSVENASDMQDGYTYSPKYNKKCTAVYRFTYPDLNKLIYHELFKYCAENNLKDVDLSMSSDFVKGFVKKNYKDYLTTSEIQIVVLADDTNIKFLHCWITDFEYYNYLLNWTLISGSFEKNTKMDYKEISNIANRFNDSELDKVITELEKFEGYSEEAFKEFTNLKSIEEEDRIKFMNDLLEISKISLYPLNCELTRLNTDDNTTYTSKIDGVLLYSIPYISYDDENYGLTKKTLSSFTTKETYFSGFYGSIAQALVAANYEYFYDGEE